jgi:hypothetical protein
MTRSRNWTDSAIDYQDWKAYALREQLETLNGLAAVVGEQDQRVIDARAAWRKGDPYAMGALINAIKGARHA